MEICVGCLDLYGDIYIYFLLHVNIECNGIYYPIMWILRHLLRRFFSSMFVSKFSHSDLDTFFAELIIWIAWMNSMWASECVCINIKALCTLTWFDVKKKPLQIKKLYSIRKRKRIEIGIQIILKPMHVCLHFLMIMRFSTDICTSFADLQSINLLCCFIYFTS